MKTSARARNWFRRLLFTIIALFAGYLLAGFLLIPAVATFMAPRMAKDHLKGDIDHGWIWLNPLTFQVSVKDFSWKDPAGDQLAGFKRFRLNANPVGSLFKGEWRVAELSLLDGFLDVTINEDGSLNLLEALVPQQVPAEADDDEFELPPVWLGLLDVSGLRIELRDLSRKEPFEKTISPISLRMTDLRTAPGEDNPYTVNALTGADEEFKLDGRFQLKPLQLAGTLSGRNIQLSDYVLFVTETEGIRVQSGHLNFELSFNARLANGRASAELSDTRIELGNLSSLFLFAGDVSTSANLSELLFENIAVSVELDPESGLTGTASTGRLQLAGFSATMGDDNRPVAAFEALNVDSIEAELVPLSIRTSAITWTRPEFDIERDENGEFVLLGLLGKQVGAELEPMEEGLEEAEETADSRPNIQIAAFRIEEGRFRFSDASVSPTADYALDPVNFVVEPLSLDPESVSDATLDAIFQETSSIELTGRLHPGNPFLESNASMSVREMPLDGYSPYTRQFIGRPVTKGTFEGDFTYAVTDSVLKANNVLNVQSIGFGDVVSGYTGKTYPVDLAVALLQNPQNEIAIDIPVSGSLDDPTFHPFSVIPGVLANLLLKAVTSPFNLVASMTGSIIPGVAAAEGDAPETDYSKVSFVPGGVDFTDSAQDVLKVVAEMLDSRPKIRLALQGSVDPQTDMEALREQRFNDRLATVEGADRKDKVHMAYLREVLGIDPSAQETKEAGAPQDAEEEAAATEAAEPVAAESGEEKAAREIAAVNDSPKEAEAVEPEKSSESTTFNRRRGLRKFSRPVASVTPTLEPDPAQPAEEETAQAESTPEPRPDDPVAKTAAAASDQGTGKPMAETGDLAAHSEEPASLPELPPLDEMETALEDHWFDADPDLAPLARERAVTVRNRFMEGFGIAGDRLEIVESALETSARVEFSLKAE